MSAQNEITSLILAIVDARDFMSYQLSRAHGYITRKEYNNAIKKYKESIGKEGDDILVTRCKILYELFGNCLDIDIICTCLKCDFVQAFRVYREVKHKTSNK